MVRLPWKGCLWQPKQIQIGKEKRECDIPAILIFASNSIIIIFEVSVHFCQVQKIFLYVDFFWYRREGLMTAPRLYASSAIWVELWTQHRSWDSSTFRSFRQQSVDTWLAKREKKGGKMRKTSTSKANATKTRKKSKQHTDSRRVLATLSRRLSDKKPTLFVLSPLLLTNDTITTSVSQPWLESTVATRTFFQISLVQQSLNERYLRLVKRNNTKSVNVSPVVISVPSCKFLEVFDQRYHGHGFFLVFDSTTFGSVLQPIHF